MKRLQTSIITALTMMTSLHGEDRLETVRVESLQEMIEQKGKVKDVVEKTEVISHKEIEKQQAVTLIEAIEKSPGVAVTTNCSMCGIKRVMLNGMKGEHTTVLADGVPFHSTVSSYYGMDAQGTSDVESIEIARGSGASLTAPEAIGGTLNIVSRRAKKNGAEFDFSVGEQGYKNGSFIAEGITKDKKTGIILSGSYSHYDQYDQDKNGVNEAPKLENQSFSLKAFHQLTPKDLLDLKLSHSFSRVYGGPMLAKGDAITTGHTLTFIGNDVRNAYDLTQAMGIFEKIDTIRDEMIGKWTHVGDAATIQTTVAYADARQNSMYEGTDYNNKDKTFFADIKVSQPWNDDHFLTYGVDVKRELMKASSSKFVATPNSTGHDDFLYSSYGLYLQDTWTINDRTELNMALRGTKITTNFTGQLTKGNEIDETIVVPRLHLRYNHTPSLTSRFSAGQGYRSPLTFFESEHGLLDNGFRVDINKIEKATNATYALSYDKGALSVTTSFAYSQVKNMAHIIEDGSGTMILVNDHNTVSVRNGDIVAGYAITPTLSVSGGYEQYSYDTDYKQLLYIAAVEKRARVMVDWDVEGWDIVTQATWTGSRNLEPYGYTDRYNDMAQTSAKSTKAPSFTTIDLKVSRELSKTWTLYAGVKNLLDYTQTSKESPLFYDANGYDTGHIWGPLRGRMSYVGLKASF